MSLERDKKKDLRDVHRKQRREQRKVQERNQESRKQREVTSITKTCLRAVRPMSEESLKYPRTLRTGSRLANKIKKAGRKWTGSMESGCCMIRYRLDSFYLPFQVIQKISFLSCLLYSRLCNTNTILQQHTKMQEEEPPSLPFIALELKLNLSD